MAEDRLITVAIHTYEKAVILKTLLENEGVPTVLHNVNLVQPVVSSGVRVRIQEKDLPLALRIIENTDIFGRYNDISDNGIGSDRLILVPIDFSEYAMSACKVAFNMAYCHKQSILLLHSFILPDSTEHQLSKATTFDRDNDYLYKTLEEKANESMSKFVKQIKELIKTGEINPVKFYTHICEGVPEDTILEVAKQRSPELIVMGTRGAGKKEKELIGSVTAEVLDSCRTPIFTIPETLKIDELEQINTATFFCTLQQDDILTLDAIYRLLPNNRIRVSIMSIVGKMQPNRDTQQELLKYCIQHYPRFSFEIKNIVMGNLLNDTTGLEHLNNTQLIIVTNKKKNIFARLFNPGIAHKLLFHTDIPMFVIPV